MLLDTLHTGGFVSVHSERHSEMESELEDVDEWFYQAQLERLERLTTALRNAKAGKATEDDWTVICYECGIKKELLWD